MRDMSSLKTPIFLNRIIVLLLIPCFLIDTGLTHALCAPSDRGSQNTEMLASDGFESQALTLRMASAVNGLPKTFLFQSGSRFARRFRSTPSWVKLIFAEGCIALIFIVTTGVWPIVQRAVAPYASQGMRETHHANPYDVLNTRQPSKHLVAYGKTHDELSTGSWDSAGPPYFVSNEEGHAELYTRIKDRGGAMIGVSFDQNYSFLAHQNPSRFIFMDINVADTQVLVPFYGHLMELAPTRKRFLSLLMGMELSDKDLVRLLNAPDRNSLTNTMQELVHSIPKQEQDARFQQFLALLDETLDQGTPNLYPWQHHMARDWISQIFHGKNLLLYNDVNDQGHPLFMSLLWNSQAGRETWLSKEEYYQRVRKAWLNDRIVGVTGDIGGKSIPLVSRWLGARNETVSSIYLSNVERWNDEKGPARLNADMLTMWKQLPRQEETLVLGAYINFLRNNIDTLRPYVWSYERLDWLYHYVRGQSDGTVNQLIEVPLTFYKNNPLSGFQSGLRHEIEIHYRGILEQLEMTPTAFNTYNPETFTNWANKEYPYLDTDDENFRALVALLVELKMISPSPDETRGALNQPPLQGFSPKLAAAA
jgi:hypothetical protein